MNTANMNPDLTKREIEVLHLLAEGLDKYGIGRRLSLSESTVARHISRILAKLHAANRAQGIHVAYQRGILTVNGETPPLRPVRPAPPAPRSVVPARPRLALVTPTAQYRAAAQTLARAHRRTHRTALLECVLCAATQVVDTDGHPERSPLRPVSMAGAR